MKRIIALLLCLSLILAGCQSGKKKDSEGKNEDNGYDNSLIDDDDKNDESEKKPNEDQSGQIKDGMKLLGINQQWNNTVTGEIPKPDFILPDYKAEVKSYKIAKDLSNIENIGQFAGFTKEQTKALVENGFVVLPTGTTRLFYTYDSNEYLGIPSFITADSVLHTYHQFYDKSLTGIELGYLYEDLDKLTEQLLRNSLILFATLEDDTLKSLQESNVIYCMIARMLMTVSSSAKSVLPTDLDYKALGINVTDGMLSLAEQEYILATAAEGYTLSPYFKFDFDYSQFTIRGHYTRTEELGRFFRAMMWLGTAPLPLVDSDKNFKYENTLQSLLMTYATFMDLDGSCPAEHWVNIYQPTAQYVGLSDDIDVFTMNNLRKAVFGDDAEPKQFIQKEYYDKLNKAVEELPEPKIQARLVELDTPTAKQFRYMGQRYILDSYVMQELIDSYLRPYPSALDVMGVLGSDTAEKLLFEEYKPQDSWPKYEEKYKQLKVEVSNYDADIWKENLYNGWVWSIQEALTEFKPDSGMPFFMTTEAWKYKSLNAALGSYTELKHDTVLYGKQSVAEGGGDIVTADSHYVEPNVALYAKLLYLTEHTIQVLNERGMMNESLMEGATIYKELLEVLISCSLKELRNETLTEEEKSVLLYYGGKLEWLSLLFSGGISDDFNDNNTMIDMLVTDVSTYMNTYVSLGTGYFDDIYVVVPVDGKLYLTRGAVYSHYEFISDTRLTDEQWWELQGIIIDREEFGEYPRYVGPSEKLPEQPFWTKKFKFDTNEVSITPLEVMW